VAGGVRSGSADTSGVLRLVVSAAVALDGDCRPLFQVHRIKHLPSISARTAPELIRRCQRGLPGPMWAMMEKMRIRFWDINKTGTFRAGQGGDN